MNGRHEAEARMQRAKAMYTRAALAALHGHPMAQAMAAAALEEINRARAELRAEAESMSRTIA